MAAVAGGPTSFISVGPGGAGVVVAGASATNAGTITGGEAGEGQGGAGVSLIAGTGASATIPNYLDNTANGVITGGLGSGAGVSLISYNVALPQGTVFNFGKITGGLAGIGSVGGDGVYVGSNVSVSGIPTDLVNTNTGTITGGEDTNSGSVGGAGIRLGTSGLAYTSGTVTGGAGYASGGAGAVVNSAHFIVTGGTVQGGRALDATGNANGGNGGAGVYVNGGGMQVFGATIAGGAGGAGSGTGTAGAAGDAIQFAPGNGGYLEIGQGVNFVGNVVGNYPSSDAIYLAGGGAATLSGIGSTITGFYKVDFTTLAQPGASWTVQANYGAAVSPAPSSSSVLFANFGTQDTLDITNLAYFNGAYATYSSGSGVLDVHEGVGGSQYYIDITTAAGAGTNFQVSSDGGTGAEGNAGTDITLQAACYLRGTRILTERGEVPIEELSVSDRVICASGERRPVRWLGYRRIDCSRYREPATVWPVCIRAGAIAEGQPARDLWLSPGHSILMDGVLIQAEKLVNGLTIVQVPRERVEYWHVELDAHAVLMADGLGAESYLDTGNRAAFVNGGRFIEAYPDFRPKHWSETCAPLVLEGEQLSKARDAVLARARARAQALGRAI